MPKRTSKPSSDVVPDTAKVESATPLPASDESPTPPAGVMVGKSLSQCAVCGGTFEGNRCAVDGFQVRDDA